jgi:hypothetical protein
LRCPLQKGGETTKKQPLLILMVFPLFEGGAAIAAGGERSEGVARTKSTTQKNRPHPTRQGRLCYNFNENYLVFDTFSYNVSGAISAPFFHAIVPPSIIANLKNSKSRNGLKTSHFSMYSEKSTSPQLPSSKTILKT